MTFIKLLPGFVLGVLTGLLILMAAGYWSSSPARISEVAVGNESRVADGSGGELTFQAVATQPHYARTFQALGVRLETGAYILTPIDIDLNAREWPEGLITWCSDHPMRYQY